MGSILRKSLILGLTLLLVLLSVSLYIIFGVKNPNPNSPIKNLTTSTITTPAQLKTLCVKDTKCYLEEVVKVMGATSVDNGLKLFINTSKITDGYYSDCHNLAHTLGMRAFTISGQDALDQHLNTCSWGYGHGVMLAAAKEYTIDKFSPIFKEYCNEDREPVGCIHGIGHSLQENKTPLSEAIIACHVAGDDIDKATNYSHITDKTTVGACVEGWVMQGIGTFPYKEMKDIKESFTICDNVTGIDGDICKYMSARNWVDMGVDENTRFQRLEIFNQLCNSSKLNNNECGRYLGEAADDLLVIGTDFNIQKVAQGVAKYCAGKIIESCTQSFTIFQINRNNGLLNNMNQVCPLLENSFSVECKKAIATRTSN